MTNKMLVVGQKYLSTKTGWECKLIFWDERTAIAKDKYGTKLECIGEKFWDYFEELPEDNKTTNPVDFKKEEVNEVERALEDLKRELSLFQIAGKALTSGNLGNSLSINYKHLANAAQNLVNALEAEKNELKITFQTPDQPELGFNSPTWSDMSKQEPKWLPMSCAPKCGSPITVKQSTNERHKIFKANWFLNKWYSLYEEGGNEEVYPEFWLEGSKEEPKIDIKEEHVDPVSIWKDVSESIYHCNFSPDQLCLYEKFIEFFEQMQKDIEELKKK